MEEERPSCPRDGSSRWRGALTVEKLTSELASARSSGTPVIYAGHGVPHAGRATGTLLVTFADKNRLNRLALGREYSWDEIGQAIEADADEATAIRITVYCCYSGGLPNISGSLAISKGPSEGLQDQSVTFMGNPEKTFRPQFKEYIMTLIRRKAYGEPLP